MIFTNAPTCPDDGSELRQSINSRTSIGQNVFTTGDQIATCPKCKRRWELRTVFEWVEVPNGAA